MQDAFVKYGLKYGPVGAIALFLVYFLANIVHSQLDKIVILTEHSAVIHNDMLSVLKDIRDSGSFNTAMKYESKTTR